jgi:hypothetical protein
MKILKVVCGLLVMAWALPLGAGEKITMNVSPAVSFAPTNLTVRALIETDAGNRAIEIIAESPDFYRSSEIQLNGEHAPRTATFEFRSVPGGTYEVRATLLGEHRQPRASARQQVNVLSGDADRGR